MIRIKLLNVLKRKTKNISWPVNNTLYGTLIQESNVSELSDSEMFSSQIWVENRGRGRSPKTVSPCTLLARALIEARMLCGSKGSTDSWKK